MEFMETAWFFPVSIAIWSVILALLLWGYFSTQRPPRGTLLWMDENVQDCLFWSESATTLGKVDGLCMALLAVFAGSMAFATSGGLDLAGLNFAEGFFALVPLVLPMVTAVATYWLTASMGGCCGIALLAGIVVSMDVFAPREPMAVIAVVAALLYGYSNQIHQNTLWQRVGILLIIGAVTAVGFHFYAGLILLLAPILLMIFLVNFENFREYGHFWQGIFCHLATFALGAVATLLACYLPEALVGGLPIFGTVFYREFYQMLLPQVAKNLSTVFNGFAIYYALFIATTHWPLLLTGLALTPVLVQGVVKHRESHSLYALIWGISLLILWLTTTVTALFFGVALALTYLWGRLYTNRRYVLLGLWVFFLFGGMFFMYTTLLL